MGNVVNIRNDEQKDQHNDPPKGGRIAHLLDELGHEKLETTMIYTHVVRKGSNIESPLDRLAL